MDFSKGMIAGVVVGTALGMTVNSISEKKKRKMYKYATKFFDRMGCAIDGMVKSFR